MKSFSGLKTIMKKKEVWSVMALAGLVCAGLVVNNVRNNNIPLHDGDVLVDSLTAVEEENPEGEGAGGTFAEKRAALDLERNDLLAKMESDERKEALLGMMKQELEIEQIIASKELPESFVILTDSNVTVTVDEQELDQNTVAKICDIVMRETGKKADHIVIQSSY